MRRLIASTLGLLLLCGCGPSLSPDDFGTVEGRPPAFRQIKEPYAMPQLDHDPAPKAPPPIPDEEETD